MTGPTRDRVVTPEAVAVTVDTATLGSRMIASMIDTAVQGLGALVLFLIFLGTAGVAGGGTSLIVFVVLLFVLVWGYYPLWEGLWGGRTPGKRAQRLRVVLADGQPASAGPILIRNLVRFVDFLPSLYVVGAVTMLVTARSQRLGDLAAGTVVIRETPVPSPEPLVLGTEDHGVDATGLSEHDYGVIRSFLQRRDGLEPGARSALARRLADTFRWKVGARPEGLGDETFIEAIASSYRGRFRGPENR